MEPRRAVEELRTLRAEAETPEVQRPGPEHRSWKAKVMVVLESSLGSKSRTFRQFSAWTYPNADVLRGYEKTPTYRAMVADFSRRVEGAAELIDAAIYQLELEYGSDEGQEIQIRNPEGPIFVVHGHDDARKYELMRLLDRAAKPEARVLHEQANRGETILQKFMRHAQAASFAVVLLTGDDEGRLRRGGIEPTLRGRQNVIFELGFFIAALGTSNVAVLMDDGVEKPSDINGLVYISLDAGGAWRHSLLKELQAAGIEVYFNRIP